jgi:hypothetical protein
MFALLMELLYVAVNVIGPAAALRQYHKSSWAKAVAPAVTELVPGTCAQVLLLLVVSVVTPPGLVETVSREPNPTITILPKATPVIVKVPPKPVPRVAF